VTDEYRHLSRPMLEFLPPNAREICRVGYGGTAVRMVPFLPVRNLFSRYTQKGQKTGGVAEMRKSKLDHPPIKQEVVKRLFEMFNLSAKIKV
jgi:hypothetical protein